MHGGYKNGYVFTIRNVSDRTGKGVLSTPVFKASRKEAKETLALTYVPSRFILTYHHTVRSK